jgi:hypothetical protein
MAISGGSRLGSSADVYDLCLVTRKNRMPYIVQRIILKSGELITEKALPNGGTLVNANSPVVGDVLEISVNGKTMMVEIIWGRWAEHTDIDPKHVFRLRAREL